MTKKEMLLQLKELQRDRKNVGTELTLWALLELLIAYFKKGGEKE